MNKGKYIFAQVSSIIDPNDFLACVKKYEGDHKVKHFSCWNQLMCLLFGQLANRESLSDLLTCLNTQKSKWYHLGFGTGISKSNLAYANENRDWQIFSEYAYFLIAKARKICLPNCIDLSVKGNVYAIDSSTVDLCLSVFWWAKFRKHKAAVKLHTQLDIRTGIPHFIQITDGSVHDVNFLDEVNIEPGSFYVLDRGYLDFGRLNNIHQQDGYFVTRLKSNSNYRRLYSANKEGAKGVKCDQTVKLNNHYASKDYPENLRRIKYWDEETKQTFNFVTNNFEITALEVALLYKYRWKIELFFKWIKQHLKVKSFWGYSENAVKIQIYTAIIAYVTVAIMKEQLKLKHSNYEILQILSITLLNKTPVNQLFEGPSLQDVKELNHNQLIMF